MVTPLVSSFISSPMSSRLTASKYDIDPAIYRNTAMTPLAPVAQPAIQPVVQPSSRLLASTYDVNPSIYDKGAAVPKVPSVNPLGGSGTDVPWYKDGDAMSGYAGLAGSMLQLAALPSQMKLAKVQRQGLEQNLRQAKIDSAFKAAARANLNAPRLGG